MPRKPRIHYPGALYHVIMRGNARQDIFFDDADRSRFYLLLQEGIERYGHQVHAFCQMSNHVHLAVQVGDVPLSRIMQNLSFRYTRWVNWRLERSGHLFQGRYKAILVETDAYLLQLVGYLHLNPLRAGIVSGPEDYPWSSHRAYLGRENIPWLSTRLALSQLSDDSARARRLFHALMNEQREKGHREDFHGGDCDGRILGQDAFIETVLSKAGEVALTKPGIEVILTAVDTLYELGGRELSAAGQGRTISEARAMAAWAVRELSDATLTDLGSTFGRDLTSLSSAVRRLTTRARTDADLQQKMVRLRDLVDKFAGLQA